MRGNKKQIQTGDSKVHSFMFLITHLLSTKVVSIQACFLSSQQLQFTMSYLVIKTHTVLLKQMTYSKQKAD
jgi:hypothetical protein